MLSGGLLAGGVSATIPAPPPVRHMYAAEAVLFMEVKAALSAAFSREEPMLTKITEAKIPIMHTTTNISITVKPSFLKKTIFLFFAIK